jgi:hypothetical protein
MFALFDLEERLAQGRRRNRMLLLAIMELRRARRERERERRPRSSWMRPWVSMRRNMGK